MSKVLKVGGGVVLLLAVCLGLLVTWASVQTGRAMSEELATHEASFPIPFPLSEAELAVIDLEGDPAAVALERSIERGRHLVEARYGCTECHGADFGGGVMVDAFPMGSFLGPNLTSGQGGVVADYDAVDWDRAVRHGVLANGLPSVMPAQDFLLMSDQELSDIVAYIGTVAPVDNEVPAPTFGPLGKVLAATGALPRPYDVVGSHESEHAALPPPAEVTVEFGRHLAGVCVGCHQGNMAGGVVPGGDPTWPPASNLTPHEDGLVGWTLEDFRGALLNGSSRDGTPLIAPMTFVQPYAANMTETEMEALWLYVQSLPAAPTN